MSYLAPTNKVECQEDLLVWISELMSHYSTQAEFINLLRFTI